MEKAKFIESQVLDFASYDQKHEDGIAKVLLQLPKPFQSLSNLRCSKRWKVVSKTEGAPELWCVVQCCVHLAELIIIVVGTTVAWWYQWTEF